MGLGSAKSVGTGPPRCLDGLGFALWTCPNCLRLLIVDPASVNELALKPCSVQSVFVPSSKILAL